MAICLQLVACMKNRDDRIDSEAWVGIVTASSKNYFVTVTDVLVTSLPLQRLTKIIPVTSLPLITVNDTELSSLLLL
jgi:hypothetical protein